MTEWLPSRPGGGRTEPPKAATRCRGELPAHALTRYYASALFRGYEPATRKTSAGAEPLRGSNAGSLPLAAFRREDIEKSRDKRRDTAGLGRQAGEVPRGLLRLVRLEKLIAANPATGIGKINTSSEGFHAWTVDEVRQFEKRRTRSACRRACARAAPAHRRTPRRCLRAGTATCGRRLLLLRSRKRTGGGRPVRGSDPVRPELQVIIDATPTGERSFIISMGARTPRRASATRMQDWCNGAGLPHLGARCAKAAATILARRAARRFRAVRRFRLVEAGDRRNLRSQGTEEAHGEQRVRPA